MYHFFFISSNVFFYLVQCWGLLPILPEYFLFNLFNFFIFKIKDEEYESKRALPSPKLLLLTQKVYYKKRYKLKR